MGLLGTPPLPYYTVLDIVCSGVWLVFLLISNCLSCRCLHRFHTDFRWYQNRFHLYEVFNFIDLNPEVKVTASKKWRHICGNVKGFLLY